jgi:F0F1-type ATP synthase membrane subunit b/b'
MPDFETLQKLLDQAERNLQEIQMLTDQIVTELKASATDEVEKHREHFMVLCRRRAQFAKRHLDASISIMSFDLRSAESN